MTPWRGGGRRPPGAIWRGQKPKGGQIFKKKNDSREGLKTAFLTLLPNEGAPASDEGKKKRAARAFFEADRCRGRPACRVDL